MNQTLSIKSHHSKASTTWRVFCAIEMPDEVRRRVVAHTDRLREAMPTAQASWTKMENIHLTLKFFGNVEPTSISKISKAADAVAQHFPTIKVRVEGTGAFPKHGPARVLWIGLNDPAGKLIDLQKEFDDECVAEGFVAEDRAFHPHLTVARLRSPKGARTLGERHRETKFDVIDFTVAELTVFRSELSSKGSRYTAISKHRLSSKN